MALILDSEALSALARPRSSPLRHERVRAAMRSAQRRQEPVRVPSATLLELYRGTGTDELIDIELGRGYAKVITTGVRIARIAGHLLASIGAGSELAVDALVVATAVRLGGGLILTHDPSDLRRLAAGQPNVRVAAV
ncbi:MAG: type II toxin-antitoxin system VapC family toxin [Acidimicrobiales bacterium]